MPTSINLGQVETSITADSPAYGVFNNNGAKVKDY